jgi:ParB-like chromosome segregation protein Spo0J
MAKQETIPAIIRDLTDLQAIEANLIEQLHRADLSPMEEANGYHRLLNDHGFSVEDIAEKIGKSCRHVRTVLQLRQTPESLREFVETKRLPYSTAVLVARVPNEKIREEVAKKLLAQRKAAEQFPTRERVQEWITTEYMIELKQTPFDQRDTAIFELATGSQFSYTGSCAACPKRTGNARDEYPDARANICTDPPCYRAKVKASVEKRIAEAEAEGLDVLDQDESETALRHGVPGQFSPAWTSPACQSAASCTITCLSVSANVCAPENRRIPLTDYGLRQLAEVTPVLLWGRVDRFHWLLIDATTARHGG